MLTSEMYNEIQKDHLEVMAEQFPKYPSEIPYIFCWVEFHTRKYINTGPIGELNVIWALSCQPTGRILRFVVERNGLYNSYDLVKSQ